MILSLGYFMQSIVDLFNKKKDLNIHKWHHYLPIYQRHFEKFVGKKIKFLEIGTQRGGSTLLFKEWFGEQAHITSVDIDPGCEKIFTNHHNIDVVIGDQSDKNFLKNLAKNHGPWDVVLDDGGHTCNQVLTSFEYLYSYVREEGVYLIEDLNSHFWKEEFDDHPQKKTARDLLLSSFDSLHDWTGKRSLFNYWHKPLDERNKQVPASNFCKTTNSIHCYDSILVFEKLKRQEPYSEWRGVRGNEQKDLGTEPAEIKNSFYYRFKNLLKKISGRNKSLR
jgi:hypothetical protein